MRRNRNKPSKLARIRAKRMAKHKQGQSLFAKAKSMLPTFLVGLVIVVGLVGTYILWRSPSVLPNPEGNVTFFQIATGSVGGTYFPVGKSIAKVISKPPGAVACADGGKCGVDGLIAIAKASPGSIANVRSVNSALIDSALAQADVVTWAFEGIGPFEKEEKFKNLRVMASLYPEAIHLVASKASGIKRVEDLRGKRVSTDRPGSGTHIDAHMLLKAFGIGENDIIQHMVDASHASDMVLAGELDAYFLIAGTPSLAISDLAERSEINLIPISGDPATKLQAENKYFTPTIIAKGTYKGIDEIKTLSVRALWITHVKKSRKMVRNILEALWRKENAKTFLKGHKKMTLIKPDTAVQGIAIPIHRGARDYYEALGLLEQ